MLIAVAVAVAVAVVVAVMFRWPFLLLPRMLLQLIGILVFLTSCVCSLVCLDCRIRLLILRRRDVVWLVVVSVCRVVVAATN